MFGPRVLHNIKIDGFPSIFYFILFFFPMIPIRFLRDPHQISPKKSPKKTQGILKK
jgi:hypothetical protein